MPNWNQIQSQLRSSNNPVVFLDIAVGTTVSQLPYLRSSVPLTCSVFRLLGNWPHDIRTICGHCSTDC